MKSRKTSEDNMVVPINRRKLSKWIWGMLLPMVVLFAALCARAGNGAVRDLPDVYTPNVPLTVIISVSLDSGCVWGAEETPPAGWTVTDVSEGGTFFNTGGNSKVKFGIFFDGPDCGGVVSRVLSYTVVPPIGEAGTKSFTGEFSIDGVGSAIGGDSEIESDADADGVPDFSDLCPGTLPDGVVDANGCSIDQLVPCNGPASGGTWKTHGEYVSAVRTIATEFLAAGLITHKQSNSIVSQAAQSWCGQRR